MDETIHVTKGLIGARVLVYLRKDDTRHVVEVVIEELSPSGRRCKIRPGFDKADTSWVSVGSLLIAEVLERKRE